MYSELLEDECPFLLSQGKGADTSDPLEQSIPNISQANRLKRMSQQKCLDMDKIYEILQEIKPNQKEQIKLPLERIGKYFPTAYTPKQQVDLIEKLLKNWAKQNVK